MVSFNKQMVSFFSFRLVDTNISYKFAVWYFNNTKTMKTITLKLLFVLSISLLLYSCSSDEDGIYTTNKTEFQDISLSYTPMEFEILSLINEHRNSIGLSTLNTINLISQQAINHTSYMIDEGIVSHDNFDSRYQKLVQKIAAKNVGENVAYGFRSAEAVVSSWLNSEGHRRVIESSIFTNFGISTKQDSNGRNYFTHIFVKI